MIADNFNDRLSTISTMTPYQMHAVRAKQDALSQEFQEALRVEYFGEDVPALMASRVYSKAYEDGHAYGYSEIENEYMELADFVLDILSLNAK